MKTRFTLSRHLPCVRKTLWVNVKMNYIQILKNRFDFDIKKL